MSVQSIKWIFFAGQNLKGDLEAIKYFGLTKTPWHKEDEVQRYMPCKETGHEDHMD